MIRPKWRAVLLCCYYKWRRIYSGIFSTRTGDLLQKAGPTNIRQTLEDDGHQWRDTTLWRNRNVSINFIPSIFVIVISQVGFFGFLDCIESQKASLVKQKFLIIWGLSSMQWQNSNRPPISTDSRFWMCWINSFCIWPSPDSHVRNTLYRSAKIPRVLMRGFSYIRSTVFPSPSQFFVLDNQTSGLHLERGSFIAAIVEGSEHPPIKISSRKMRLPIFFLTGSGLSITRISNSVYFTFTIIYHRTK